MSDSDVFLETKVHLTCYYCKLHDDKVEASGILYCPNSKCTGPGGAWFRVTLSSYEEHSVDQVEWDKMAELYERNKEEWKLSVERNKINQKNKLKLKDYYVVPTFGSKPKVKARSRPWWRFW